MTSFIAKSPHFNIAFKYEAFWKVVTSSTEDST